MLTCGSFAWLASGSSRIGASCLILYRSCVFQPTQIASGFKGQKRIPCALPEYTESAEQNCRSKQRRTQKLTSVYLCSLYFGKIYKDKEWKKKNPLKTILCEVEECPYYTKKQSSTSFKTGCMSSESRVQTEKHLSKYSNQSNLKTGMR